MELSKQLKWRMGLLTVGDFSSKGSIIIVKPFVYVDTNVAKWDIKTNGEKSERSDISNVFINEANRSAQNLKVQNSIRWLHWIHYCCKFLNQYTAAFLP